MKSIKVGERDKPRSPARLKSSNNYLLLDLTPLIHASPV